MSRSGYVEDMEDQWAFIRYRGAVKSAFKGKRGQAFLKELLAALDALPEKKLIAESLELPDGPVCAIGAVGRARGIDMSVMDPDDIETVAGKFQISEAMAREIVWMNDDMYYKATPEARFEKMRAWIAGQIKPPAETPGDREVVSANTEKD